EQVRKIGADGRLYRAEFRLLSEDNDIDVDNMPVNPVQTDQCFAEKQARIGVFPLRFAIGISVADVAHARRAEESVCQGVEHNIGIAVANESARMLNANAAQNERPPFREPMGVVTDADAHANSLTEFRPSPG